VDNCYSNETYRYVKYNSLECVDNCSFYELDADNSTMNCQPTCTDYYGFDVAYSEDVKRCAAQCSMFSNFETSLYVQDSQCLPQCNVATPYYEWPQKMCMKNCTPMKTFAESTHQCVAKCSSAQFNAQLEEQQMYQCEEECKFYLLSTIGNQEQH